MTSPIQDAIISVVEAAENLNRDSTLSDAQKRFHKERIFGEFMELIDDTTVAFLLDVIVEARRRAVRDAKGEK
jgi:hypothetical protein